MNNNQQRPDFVGVFFARAGDRLVALCGMAKAYEFVLPEGYNGESITKLSSRVSHEENEQ